MQERRVKMDNRPEKSVKWREENSWLISAPTRSRMQYVRAVLEYRHSEWDPEERFQMCTTRIFVLRSKVSWRSIRIMGMCVFVHKRNWERFCNMWFMERRPKEKHKHITCLHELCGPTTLN